MRAVSQLEYWTPRVILAAMLSSWGCAAVLPAHPRSQKVQDERVELQLDFYVNRPSVVASDCPEVSAKKEEEKAFPAVLAAAAIPIVADFTIKTVVSELDKEAARYTGDYQAFVSDDKFYQCRGPGAPINLKRVKLERRIGAEKALVLTLDVEPSLDQTAFRLVPVTAELYYSKAKVLQTRWWLPWTWGVDKREAIDLDVNFTIEALWTDSDNAIHRAVLGELPIPLRGVPLAGPEKVRQFSTASGWFPAVPRSRPSDGKGESFGTGTYTIRATVREYDDAGKRVKALSEVVEKNRESTVTKISDSLAPKKK